MKLIKNKADLIAFFNALGATPPSDPPSWVKFPFYVYRQFNGNVIYHDHSTLQELIKELEPVPCGWWKCGCSVIWCNGLIAENDTDLRFCSEKCREEYERERQAEAEG